MQRDSAAVGPAGSVGAGGGAGEVQGEGVGRGVAGRRVVGEGAHEDCSHGVGDPGGWWRSHLKFVAEQRHQGQRRIERRGSGEQFVEDDRESVEIRGRAEAAAVDLFGRHVFRSTDNLTGGDCCGVENLRNAEVGDFQLPGFGEQDIVGLDVAVQYPPGVGAVQCFGDGEPCSAGSFGGKCPVSLTEGSSGQQLHDEQAEVAALHVVVDPDDVGVVESGK